jgi:hypothetical protein
MLALSNFPRETKSPQVRLTGDLLSSDKERSCAFVLYRVHLLSILRLANIASMEENGRRLEFRKRGSTTPNQR